MEKNLSKEKDELQLKTAVEILKANELYQSGKLKKKGIDAEPS